MDYRIESREGFKVYGIEGIFTPDGGRHLIDIPNFWQTCMNDGRFKRLMDSTNDPSNCIHAICQYRETGEKTFPYMLFAYQTEKSSIEGFVQVDVPAATWAIFKTEKHTEEQTSSMIQSLAKRVYTDWLPTSSYKKIDGYELELYFDTEDGMYYCETWIRVVPK